MADQNKEGSLFRKLTAEERAQKKRELQERQQQARTTSESQTNLENRSETPLQSSENPTSDSANKSSAEPSKPAETEATSQPPATSQKVDDLPVRENLVQAAVKFLSDPKVSSSPLAKRIEFLESKKGLTPQEIKLALERAGETAPSSISSEKVTNPPIQPQQATTINTSSPAPIPNAQLNIQPNYQPQPSQSLWKDIFIFVSIIGGGSWLLSSYLQSVILPAIKNFTTARKALIDARLSQLSNLSTQLENTQKHVQEISKKSQSLLNTTRAEIAATQRQVTEVVNKNQKDRADIQSLRSEIANLESAADINTPYYAKVREDVRLEVDKIKSEIKTLKGQLLNRRNFPAPPPSTVWSTPGQVQDSFDVEMADQTQ